MFAPASPVYACDLPLPEADHAGMSWVGSDLVIGSAAVAAGQLPGLWDDGACLTCRRDGDAHVLATDPRGMARLYLYCSGRRWAASSSFAALVEAMAARRWPLHPCSWALNGWSLTESDFHQTPFPETAAAEIRLLAHWQVLRIRNNTARIEPRPPSGPPPEFDSLLRLWLGRMLTVLTSADRRLSLELTGGLDSRTCLAFALHLRDSGQVADLSGLPLISARGAAEDLSIASRLADAYGLTLNPPERPDLLALPAALRFARWREMSLGTLTPPYLLPPRIDPGLVTIGGQGGEYLRLLSWAKDRSTLLALGRDVPGRMDRWRWRRSLGRAWAEAQGREQPAAPAALQARWAWRVRQLQGHLPRFLPRMMPLAGIGFRHWLAAQPSGWMQDGRVLFRIQERLAPGLAQHPFADAGYRLPEGLVRGGPPLFGQPGKVLAGPPDPAIPADPRPLSGASLADLFRKALDRAEADGAGRLISPAQIAAARAVMALQKGDRLPGVQGFIPVHVTLLAGLLAGARRPG